MSEISNAVLDEIWFWDGDFGHLLGCVEGQEEKWLCEKGVLKTEDEELPGVKELLQGDVVFRARTAHAFERAEDPREKLFQWFSINPLTGVLTPRPEWG